MATLGQMKGVQNLQEFRICRSVGATKGVVSEIRLQI